MALPGRTLWSGLALLALIVVGLPGSVGAKAVSEAYAPVNGSFTVTGHGWGHGHGMSQYGARGAARAGLSAAQILAFYYPGTTPAHYNAPIRVRLMADGGGVQVVAEGTQAVRAPDGSNAVYLPVHADIDRWRLAPVGGGNELRFHRKSDNTWNAYWQYAGDAEFVSSTDTLRLVTSSGITTYRGAMRAAASKPGAKTRYTVNVVSTDDYVRGVVASEMPTSWEPAAVQAQAVAARSYGAFEATAYRSRSYDLCDTTSCQVYRGMSGETAAGNAAVVATTGTIVAYQGTPAFTQFSSSFGGYSSPGSRPYLVGQADPYEAGGGNPYYTWTATVSTASIEASYPALGTLQAIRVTNREGGGDWGGYVNTVVLDGSSGDVTISGDTFRSKFGLRSRYYTFGGSVPAATPPPAPEAPARVVPTTKAGITAELKAVAGNRIGKPKGKVVKRGSWSSLRFSNGIAYFHKSGRTYLLKGRLAKKYVAMGGTKSSLGAPTSTYTWKKGTYRATFAKGVLKYNSKSKRYITLRK